MKLLASLLSLVPYLAAFVFFFGQAYADGALTNGAISNDSISTFGDSDEWTIFVAAGDYVVVAVAETDDGTGFSPNVQLFAPSGALVSEDDRGESVRLAYQMQSSGTAKIIVSDDGNDDTGSYKIEVHKHSSSFIVSNGDHGGALTNGIRHTGVIDSGDVDRYYFDAEIGDYYVLSVSDQDSSGMEPLMWLLAPDGTLVSIDDRGQAVRLAGNLSQAGRYTVFVADDYSGSTSGPNESDSYTLEFHLSRDDLSYLTSDGDEGGELGNGLRHLGTIDPGDVDRYYFDAEIGDYYVLSVSDQNSSGMEPLMWLLAPDGTLVSIDDRGQAVRLAGSLSQAGRYTVFVADDYSGSTSGPNESDSYTLEFHLSRDDLSYVTSDGDEGGELGNGLRHLGTIDPGDVDRYYFDAEIGDYYVLSVSDQDSSGMEPLMWLLAPDGTLVSIDDRGQAVRLSGTTEQSGRYTVFVADDYSGSTSGPNESDSYTLEFHLSRDDLSYAISDGDEGGELGNGLRHLGAIDPGDVDRYYFDAEIGESYVLSVSDQSSGGMDPIMWLRAPDGTSVSFADNSQAVRLAGSLSQTGRYTVFIADDYSGSTSGPNESDSYVLEYHLIGHDYTVSSGDEGERLKNGILYEGTIDSGDFDVYIFKGGVDGYLKFQITETSSGAPLDLQSWLYTPDGVYVAGHSDSDFLEIEWSTTPQMGYYTLIVMDTSDSIWGPNETGDYSIQIWKYPLDLEYPEDATVEEGDTQVLPLYAVDPFDPNRQVTFELVNPVEGASIQVTGPSTANVVWTPAESQGPGDVVFTVAAKIEYLGRLHTCEEIFTMTVEEINVAPQITASISEPILHPEDELFVFDLQVVDPDTPDNALTYELIDAPVGMTLSNLGILEWATAETDGSTQYRFTVRVTDSNPPAINQTSFEVEREIVLSVTDTNELPQVQLIAPQTANEGLDLSVQVVASDTDLPTQSLSYDLDAAAKAKGLSIDANGLITWNPGENAGPDVFTITVFVFDGVTTVEASFQVSVIGVNAAPTDIGLSGSSVPELQAPSVIVGELSVTDSDSGDSHTYSIFSGNTGGAFRVDGDVLLTDASLDFDVVASYDLVIKVADVAGASTTKLFTITVIDRHLILTTAENGSITLSPNQFSYEDGSSVTLTAVADTDFEFSGWGGDATGSGTGINLVLTSDVSVVANFVSTEGPKSWFDGAIEIQPAGWLYFDWFKGFKPEGENWIYHGRHGWLYTLGENTGGLFLWDVALGRWMFTNETAYPWMYAYGEGGGWVFFFEGGRPGARYFKRGDTGSVVSAEQLSL